MSFSYFGVRSIRQETSDVKSFVLQPEDETFAYLPGQFLTIVPDSEVEIRRSYSFSSHPAYEFPTITLKRISNGAVSRWLFDKVREGDRLRTIGASGLFTLPDDLPLDETLFFLAAGSGITPVRSLILEALRRQHQRIVLAYSNRSAAETIFYKELNDLQRDFPSRLTIEYFFSNHMNLHRARLGRLALEKILSRHAVKSLYPLFYLCGPRVYMQNITITLLTEGFPLENIRKEIFYNPLPSVSIAPPDKERHKVTIRYQGQTFSFAVQYPKSILQTAKAKGIMLPYSCESGRCSTCAATCTKGEVWMLRNEVLLDKEIAKGRVLTCTGYPVGGDVELVVGQDQVLGARY